MYPTCTNSAHMDIDMDMDTHSNAMYVQTLHLKQTGSGIILPKCSRTFLAIAMHSSKINPWMYIAPSKSAMPASKSSALIIFFVNHPLPAAHRKPVLNGVDAPADGGEHDEKDNDDDCDDDVALDHGGG